MSSGAFKNVTYKLFVYKSYIRFMYKEDLALNNLQGLICYKTQPTNQSTSHQITHYKNHILEISILVINDQFRNLLFHIIHIIQFVNIGKFCGYCKRQCCPVGCMSYNCARNFLYNHFSLVISYLLV